MEAGEKKRKRKAVIVTVVFHAVALVLFLIFGLTQPVPLPEEQGASIEFGWDVSASGDAMADIQSETAQEVPESQPEEATDATETPVDEVAVEDEGSIAVPPKEEKKPKKPKTEPKPKEPAKPVEVPKPTVSDALSNALNALSNPSGGGSQGDGEGAGDQGNPQGTTGKGALGGGSGSWQLDGRSMLPGFGTKIKTTSEEGIVVLNIAVDQNGRVTQASPNLKESTTTSQYLINLAINDAKNNFRFNSDPGSAIEQRGKVRFVFQLK